MTSWASPFDADKASFLCQLRSLEFAQSHISRASIHHCQHRQRLGSSICNCCEPGPESQCRKTIAKPSPGAHIERAKQISSLSHDCNHWTCTSSEANIFPSNCFWETSSSLLCIKLRYTRGKQGPERPIILICISKTLSWHILRVHHVFCLAWFAAWTRVCCHRRNGPRDIYFPQYDAERWVRMSKLRCLQLGPQLHI